MNEEPKNIPIDDDDEWTTALEELSDQEHIDHGRNMIDNLRKNLADLPGITPQLIDELEAKLNEFEQAVENEKVALRNSAEATARLERSGDAYLAALGSGENEKGH